MNQVDQRNIRHLNISRLIGIATSIFIATVLLLYYFRIIDEWVVSLFTVLLSGVDFVINAVIMESKQSSLSVKLNLTMAVFFLLVGVGFLIYGIVSDNLLFI